MIVLFTAALAGPPVPPADVDLATAVFDTGTSPAEAPTGAAGGGGLGLVVLAAGGAVLLAAAGSAARSAARDLPPTGLLPSVLRGIEVGARAAALACVVAAALLLLPGGLRWVVPWGGVALALAVGWSARDVLPDWVAWTFLATEGHLRPGTWVRGDGFEGIVRALRPRVLWVVDDRGRLAAVPNRIVARSVLHSDPAGHPEVEVHLDLAGVEARTARAAITEAVWLSPWLAPETPLRITVDPVVTGRWTVRLRLVDLSCRDRFVGTFRERVSESLHPQAGTNGAPAL